MDAISFLLGALIGGLGVAVFALWLQTPVYYRPVQHDQTLTQWRCQPETQDEWAQLDATLHTLRNGELSNDSAS